ncbi:MAG: hypothetical protein AVDCRST_MAG06-3139, partial [uncultured Nocardioides sp.]
EARGGAPDHPRGRARRGLALRRAGRADVPGGRAGAVRRPRRGLPPAPRPPRPADRPRPRRRCGAGGGRAGVRPARAARRRRPGAPRRPRRGGGLRRDVLLARGRIRRGRPTVGDHRADRCGGQAAGVRRGAAGVPRRTGAGPHDEL